jgi:hypothetical protein
LIQRAIAASNSATCWSRFSYNEPSWIGQRHGVAGGESTIDKMTDLLKAIAGEENEYGSEKKSL